MNVLKKVRDIVIKTKTEDNAKELVLLEEGEIVEYKKEKKNLVGNIYAARVTDSLESLNASFADIGLDRSGFIKGHVLPTGSMVMVEVQSGEHHEKGVAVSPVINLSGVYSVLIFNPRKNRNEVKVSKNITDEDRLQSLLKLGYRALSKIDDSGFRVILRTDTENAKDEVIAEEIISLYQEYKQLKVMLEESNNNPKLLKESDDPVTEMIRRYPLSSFKTIYTDDPRLTLNLARKYSGITVKTVGSGKNEYDIFDILNISNRLTQLSGRKVWLKSGAYILIEPTETMTVIDVNSGKFKDIYKKEKEEAIFQINKEAATEVMRQLRFRNIGGIIICDFIDMKSTEFQEELLEYMRNLARDDFEHPSVIDITKLGLAEITRKRS